MGRQSAAQAADARPLLVVGEDPQGEILQAEHVPRRPRVRLSRQPDCHSPWAPARARPACSLHLGVPILEHRGPPDRGDAVRGRPVAVYEGPAVLPRQYQLSWPAVRFPRAGGGGLLNPVASSHSLVVPRRGHDAYDRWELALRGPPTRPAVDATSAQSLPTAQRHVRGPSVYLYPGRAPLLRRLRERP